MVNLSLLGFLLGLVVVGKKLRSSFHQGLFPDVNLTGMDLKELGDFPLKSGQGHLGLEQSRPFSLKEGQVPASQIAVLARFTPPIYSVLKALTEKGVHATYVGDRAISRSIGVRFVKCIVGVSAGSPDAQSRVAKILSLLEQTVGNKVCSPETLAKMINALKYLDVSTFVEAVLNELSLSDALDATNRRYLTIASRAVRIAALNGDSRDYASVNTALTLEWNRLERTVQRGVKGVDKTYQWGGAKVYHQRGHWPA